MKVYKENLLLGILDIQKVLIVRKNLLVDYQEVVRTEKMIIPLKFLCDSIRVKNNSVVLDITYYEISKGCLSIYPSGMKIDITSPDIRQYTSPI